ncbi:uncharacterized protein (UPF0332 family) [Kineosphaera limosa]|uniref:HEPN domain-containing protein n=1 Tax=Kineosphaera limosa NBRC 100340 TaxID=1184609 RepID=K6XDQ3_9MICO|nr:HEPN domain-containing protein [Kineosphaera limosa]NYE00827.1 uncharacterized protein (UPF0332 family) [Kineosphaera limosa]GAB96954.1 hypothetical protein KILIM_053_00050 [Kineosphaera limosa NBRC 100340]
MSLSRARQHLTKAREFLDAAELNLDVELFSAATASAVTAGVNAKDAMCLALTGRTGKGQDHASAVPELRSAGPAGAAVAADLDRLVRLKTKAQYHHESVSAQDARKAVNWADRLVAAAENVCR